MKTTSLPSRQLCVRLVAATIVAATAIAWQATSHAEVLAPSSSTQSSVASGVTVKVTLKPNVLGADEQEFAVVLDTHSENLMDDLVASTVLLVDGREIRPVQWTGDAPGAHHREGLLKFPQSLKEAGAIELRIQRANEGAPRVFRWEGTALR